MNQIPESIQAIIVDFLGSNASWEDEEKLYHWLKEDKGNYLLYEEIKNTWLISEHINEKSNEEALWSQIKKRISKTKRADIHSHKKSKLFTFLAYPALKVAAMVVLLYLTGFLTFYIYNHIETIRSEDITEVFSPLGSRTSVTMPDGTRVNLNAGSLLTYSNCYGKKERKVTLEGEAFFDVITNRKKHFIVSTPTIDITAIGTSFNVKAYKDEDIVETTLVEGMVRIAENVKHTRPILLKPNQMAIYHKAEGRIDISANETKTDAIDKSDEVSPYNEGEAPLIIRQIDPEPFISWKEEQWIISHEKLDVLARKLERRYDVTFIFEDQSIKNYSFSGRLENETLQQVLNVIRLTAPIDYEVKHKQVILTSNEELKNKYKKLLEHN